MESRWEGPRMSPSLVSGWMAGLKGAEHPLGAILHWLGEPWPLWKQKWPKRARVVQWPACTGLPAAGGNTLTRVETSFLYPLSITGTPRCASGMMLVRQRLGALTNVPGRPEQAQPCCRAHRAPCLTRDFNGDRNDLRDTESRRARGKKKKP